MTVVYSLLTTTNQPIFPVTQFTNVKILNKSLVITYNNINT
jgi:hypothetical protein